MSIKAVQLAHKLPTRIHTVIRTQLEATIHERI